MIELQKSEFNKVKEVFDNLNLSIFGVLNGTNLGRVFVNNIDDEENKIIFVQTPEGIYLAGTPCDESFQLELNKTLKNDIFPKAINKGEVDYCLFYPSDDWKKAINKIFESLNPLRSYRIKLEICLDDLDFYEVSKSVYKVDNSILENKELKGKEGIEKFILKTWGTYDNFLHNGFGFIYILDNEIISWCMSDCVVDNRCEIGVETDEDFRRKGYCSEVVKAALNYCKQNNIKNVGWHCWENNVASYKLAEKIGFKAIKTFPVYFGWYNELDNYLVNGWHYFLGKEKDYVLSAEFYSKALNLGYGMAWHFFNAACVNWKIDNIKIAKEYYKIAMERGWKGRESFKGDWFFDFIYNGADASVIEDSLK